MKPLNSLQALREERAALCARAKSLLDDNPGNSFTAAMAGEVDRALVRVDAIDAELRQQERDLQDGALVAGGRAQPGQWFNADTGRAIPIAHVGDNFRAVLGPAFKTWGAPREQHGLGEFVRGISGMRTHESIRAALSEGTDSAGGFTLPAYVQLRMLEALAPNSSLLMAGAGVAMLDEGAKSYRIAAVNAIPTAAWRAEAGAVATSDPTFRSVDLVPRSLSFQFKVSRELLADAANLEPALMLVIGQAFAKELDRAGLRGSGSAPEIRGILNTSGIQSVTNGAAGASLGTTAYSNFISALQAILAANGPTPTAAIMAPRSLTTLAGLLDTTNQPRRAPPVIEAWKFISSSQIPIDLTVTSSTDCSEIYVGDFAKAAGFFFREGISIQKLNELYAGTGEIGFACHVRVDLGVLYPAAVAVVTGVRA